jgi:hypothetical protein
LDLSYKAFAARLRDGIVSEAQIAASRKVENRSRNRCDGQTLMLDDIAAAENRPVDRDPRGPTPAEPSIRRNRELDRRRVRIGKAKDRKGRLVGKSHVRAAMRLGPEDRLTIWRERIAMRVGEPIDATRNALQPAAFHHTGQGSSADTCFGVTARSAARKAAANYRKHGISFADAATVLDDAQALTIEDRRFAEQRFVTIGIPNFRRCCQTDFRPTGDYK